MNLLFIQSFLSHNYDNMITKAELIGSIWLVVIICMLVDMRYGIKKSKRLKQTLTSKKYRKTIEKANEYVVFLLFAFFVDYLLSAYFNMPWASIALGLCLVYIEAHSVWENMEKNDQREYIARAKEIIELFRNLKEKDKTQILDMIKDKLEDPKNDNHEPQ